MTAVLVRTDVARGVLDEYESFAALVESLRPLLDALDDDMWNGPSGVPDLTFGRGVLTLWYDAFVHADDIRTALGRAHVSGPGLAASVEYLAGELATKGWGP